MLREREGSILILALWVLFFLAALTVAAAGHVWAVLQAADHLQSRVTARMEATSVAAWSVAVIEEHMQGGSETNIWDGASADAWNRDVSLFVLPREIQRGGSVHFTVADEEEPYGGIVGEEGRLHLNNRSPQYLQALFAYLGGEAGAQVARELFQVSADGDAGLTGNGDEAYDRHWFYSVEDLLLVDGVDADLYARIAPHVTVYGKGDSINVNSATHAVLVVYFLSTDDPELAENAETLAEEIIAARQERGFVGRDDFEERFPALGRRVWARGPLGVASTAFRGVAVGRDASGETEREIEFVWDTISRQFVLWRER